MITLNEKGWMAILYRSFYNKTTLPDNLCAFFWKFILAIVLTITVWPAMVFNWIFAPFKWNDKYKYHSDTYVRVSTPIGALINILFLLVGWLPFKQILGKKAAMDVNPLWIYLAGVGEVAAVIAIVLLVARWVMWLSERPSKKRVCDIYEENMKWVKLDQKRRARREKWEKSFLYLCGQAILAWKDKYCPRIEWKSGK